MTRPVTWTPLASISQHVYLPSRKKSGVYSELSTVFGEFWKITIVGPSSIHRLAWNTMANYMDFLPWKWRWWIVWFEDRSFSAEIVHGSRWQDRFDTCASFYFEQFVLQIVVLLLTLCVTIATNLTNGLFVNNTRIGRVFNKLSENIYFYILTLTIMAVVFDLLRAIAEYWFRIKNEISWGTFCFQIGEYERVKK